MERTGEWVRMEEVVESNGKESLPERMKWVRGRTDVST